MAYLSVWDIEATGATVEINDLQYTGDTYDNFEFKFYLNGTLAVDFNTSTAGTTVPANTTWSITFHSLDYPGNNWLTPATQYNVEVIATRGGVNYSIPAEEFTTDSISPPSGSISPSFYTPLRDQDGTPNCVATSLATALDRIRAKASGYTYAQYSAAYIYGALGTSSGIVFEEGVDFIDSYGSPRWELVTNFFDRDNYMSLSSAQTLYSNRSTAAVNNAAKQALSGHYGVDFYNPSGVKTVINSYGCFMFNFRIPNNFYSVPTSGANAGIIPQPDSYSGTNHSAQLIGLTTKTINGISTPCWILQNSWGSTWGDGGRGYLPWNWGIGAPPPTCVENMPSSWTWDCYAIYNTNAPTNNVAKPTNITAVATGTLTATVSWDTTLTGAGFTVFASQQGSDTWYNKGSTTGTSLNITFDTTNKTYEIFVMAYVDNVYSDHSDITTVSVGKPSPFNWTYAGWNSASGVPVYGSTKNSTYDLYITAAEWNRLIKNLQDMYTYKGGGSTGISEVVAGTNMTAAQFNAVKNAIDAYNSTGLADKTNTSNILAADFNTLRTKLNAIT